MLDTAERVVLVDDEATETVAEAAKASRRWRAVWRTHFYAGAISAPILLLLAVTGLVILYTQPIQDALDHDVRVVAPASSALDYDAQAAAVRQAYPDAAIVSVVTPVDESHTTVFGLDDGRDVFVDPSSGAVLGTRTQGGGVVGLANRLHGYLNNDSVKVPVPTAAGIFGDDPLFTDLDLGDIVVEVVACWALVLAASGIYLWWPRKRHTGKALFLPRLRKKGRARWRDLHAVPGFVLSFMLAFFVMSGLLWSGFWGGSFGFAAEEVSPGSYPDPAVSSVARLGDIDRFGNKINWVLQDSPVPASPPPAADGGEHAGHGGGGEHDHGGGAAPAEGALPAPLSLDGVIRAAEEEGLKPGFALALPEDSETDDGGVVYGAYSATNPWPAGSQDALTVFFDQFTGATLGRQELYGYGTVARAADYTVSAHMGTQLGLVNRIVITVACLALIWAVVSSLVMYLKRRRPGSLGLPRRPRDLRLANRLVLIAVVLGVIYPLWGVSAVVVLTVDRLVIRKVGHLRVAFGQR